MAEWLKAHAWKACIGETLSRVRIPVSPPPESSSNLAASKTHSNLPIYEGIGTIEKLHGCRPAHHTRRRVWQLGSGSDREHTAHPSREAERANSGRPNPRQGRVPQPRRLSERPASQEHDPRRGASRPPHP